MKVSELENLIQDNVEKVLQDTLMEQIHDAVKIQFQKAVASEGKKNKANHNPYYGNPNGVSKDMEDYVNETYGAASTQNKTFRGMFGEESLSTGGFDTFGEFLKLVDSGRSDTRLVTKAPSGASESIPSDGGYIVAPEFTARIFDVALESEIVRPLSVVYPMKSHSLNIPAMQLVPHSTALYGNVEMRWVDEGGTVTPTKPTFRSMTMTANKARIDMMITNELLADSSPSYESLIGNIITSTFAYGLDSVFLTTGNGAGQPLSILNSNCLITVDAEDGQSSGTIVWENIINMYSRMHPACVGNAVWVASITAIPALMTLFFSVGTGGVPVPALREESGKFYLLGKRVYLTEKISTLGNIFDIAFCDFSQYAVGLRQELRIEKSNSPGWSTDESAWRCIVRIDGQPLWDRTLILKDGVTEVSPFVTLAAR